MQTANAIFLSVRSEYVTKIFNGTKTVELRRVRPRHIAQGALALIYVPSPVCSVSGAFKVEQVVEMNVTDLWETVQDKAGITRAEFDAYYEGALTGVAIFFHDVWILREPIELRELREEVGFQPPQGFRYVKASELAFPQFADFVADTDAAVQTSFLTD